MLMLCALTHLIHTHARKRGVIGPARDIESIFHMVNNARVGLAFRKLQDFLSHGNSRVFSASFRPFQGGYAPLILFQCENDMFIRDKWLAGSLQSTITYHSFPERVLLQAHHPFCQEFEHPRLSPIWSL